MFKSGLLAVARDNFLLEGGGGRVEGGREGGGEGGGGGGGGEGGGGGQSGQACKMDI